MVDDCSIKVIIVGINCSGIMGKEMNQVVINKEKCIGCGLCKKDCVGFDIDIVDGKAVAAGISCILCGHCEAVCPQNAVSISGYSDSVSEYSEQVRLNPYELMAAIKTRRTIRQFKDQEIPQNIIDLIIEAGRLAPTGINAQGTSYIVLKNKKAECEAVAVKIFGGLVKIVRKFVPAIKNMTIDENFFFKKAPLVIVVLGKDKVSSSLAAENMAFMAEANGLGVLFSGFFTICYNLSGKIRKIIGVSKSPKAVTTLVIGYPAVKYYRNVHRKPAVVVES